MKALSIITNSSNITQTIYFLQSFIQKNNWFNNSNLYCLLVIQNDNDILSKINKQRILNIIPNSIFIESNKYKLKQQLERDNIDKHWHPIVYSKFEIIDLLDTYHKIVYIDTDIFINQNIIELFNDNNYDIECVSDIWPNLQYISNTENKNIQYIPLSLDNDFNCCGYFNDGVLVCNYNPKLKNDFYEFISKPFDESLWDKYKPYYPKYLQHCEQDIFNFFYRDHNYKINYLPLKYNFIIKHANRIDDINKCSIIHFTSDKFFNNFDLALNNKFYKEKLLQLFPIYIICNESVSNGYKEYYKSLGFKDILNNKDILPKNAYYIELNNDEYIILPISIFEIIYKMFFNNINYLKLNKINKVVIGPETNIFIKSSEI